MWIYMKVFLPLLICSTLTLSSVKGRSFLITKTLPTLREEEIKELESYSRKVEPKESTYKNNGSNYLHLRYPNPDPGIYNLRVNVSLMNSLVPNPLSPYSLYDSFIYVQGDEHWEIIFVIEEREMNIYKCEYTDLYDPILHLRRLEYSCKIEILFIRDRGTPASGDAEEYIICREYAEMSIVYNGENNHQLTMTGISQRKNICPPGVCTIDTAIETEVNLCLDKHCTEFQDFFTLTFGDNFFLLIQIVDIRLREQFNLELLNIQYKFANMAVDINITQAVTTSSSGYLIIQCHALKTGHFIIEILTKLTTSHNLRDLSSAPISFKALKSMTQFTVCDWGG